MARKKYSCDFETTTNPNDCRVWAYGFMEVGNKKNYEIGNSLDKFMRWVEKCQGDLYFHNLKFDGSFIVNWLLKKGYKHNDTGLPKTFMTVISNMGQWYKIDICYGYKGKRKLHTNIFDSLKKLPFSVDAIGKSFKLGSMKMEVEEEFYHRPRPIGHKITDEEYGYIYNDIEVVADALKIQFEQGLTAMTSGSDSLRGFKDIISRERFERDFPIFSLELDDKLRHAYKGGFTWLNEKYAGKEIGEGLVFDVNSLYPSQMYDRDLPYGVPLPYDGEYVSNSVYPLYIQHIRCEFQLKDNKIPTIQIKGMPLRFKGNEYLKSDDGEPVDLFLTNVDLELFLDHYDPYNLVYVSGWMFRSEKGIFKDFIDKWNYIKVTKEGAEQTLAKLMLNSLYGKFASNPNVTKKIPELNEDGSNRFVMDEEEFGNPVYTAMGAFITSWARYVCISTAQKVYDRIIYCDTDSIHIVGTEIPDSIKDLIDPKRMGYWDHESTFEKARYIRQKTYIQLLYAKEVEKDGEIKVKPCLKGQATTRKLKVTCAGMPDRVKKNVTFENFKKGFTSNGKLIGRQVNGGIVLMDEVFTMK